MMRRPPCLALPLLGAVLLLAAATSADAAAAVKTTKSGDQVSHSIGNDNLRFTVTEKRALSRYLSQQRTGVRSNGEGGDEGGDEGNNEGDRDRGDRAGPARGHGNPHGLPPGLQKKAARGGELPPGWQRKIARGEVMPQSVYGSAQPLPVDIRRQLPSDPRGTVTVSIDGKVVRLYEATREIIDVLR